MFSRRAPLFGRMGNGVGGSHNRILAQAFCPRLDLERLSRFGDRSKRRARAPGVVAVFGRQKLKNSGVQGVGRPYCTAMGARARARQSAGVVSTRDYTSTFVQDLVTMLHSNLNPKDGTQMHQLNLATTLPLSNDDRSASRRPLDRH